MFEQPYHQQQFNTKIQHNKTSTQQFQQQQTFNTAFSTKFQNSNNTATLGRWKLRTWWYASWKRRNACSCPPSTTWTRNLRTLLLVLLFLLWLFFNTVESIFNFIISLPTPTPPQQHRQTQNYHHINTTTTDCGSKRWTCTSARLWSRRSQLLT